MSRKLLEKVILLFLTIAMVACEKEPGEHEKYEVEVLTNISYGNHERQVMDLYLPKGRSSANTNVVVVIHGGGFVAGDKSYFSEVSTKLAEKGFAIANINYRFVDITGLLDNPPKHQPSAITIHHQVEDVHAAIQVASARSEEFATGDSKWYIAGHSAGATLAMLYAYGENNEDGLIKAVANWAGATTFAFNDESETDQLDPRFRELFFRLIGAEATNENKLAYMAASPYWVAYNNEGIPTINIRPDDNTVGDLPDVSDVQYKKMTDMLNGKEVVSKYVIVSGASHGFSEPGKWDEVLSNTVAFFNEH